MTISQLKFWAMGELLRNWRLRKRCPPPRLTRYMIERGLLNEHEHENEE